MSTAKSNSDAQPNVDDASTSGVGGGGGDANSAESLPGPPAVARQPPTFPPFLSKCYDMIDDPSTDSTVSWSEEGNSFVIWDPHTFSRDLLPKFYKHNNLSSFVRQLNTYGFHKVDPDRWEFANEGFVRGQKHLLKTITRKKNTPGTAQPIPMQVKNVSAKACVEVGKFGLEKEIERLMRDKNVLMQELVKLRHHQQSTDSQLHGVRDRLQVMEQHQQQMLSFLAMAVQSPGFLAQLVQQNGDTRWRNEANKKRRIPALEQGADVESSPDGQIVTYQPFATENWRPLLTSAPDNGATLEQASFSDGINYMNKFVDNMFSAVDSDVQTEEEFIMDIPPDLERLLASSLPENAENADQHNIDISDLGMYFDLELPDVGMETSENLVFPSEENGSGTSNFSSDK